MIKQFDGKINDDTTLLLSSPYYEHIVFSLAAEFISLMWNAVGRDSDHRVIRKITCLSQIMLPRALFCLLLSLFLSPFQYNSCLHFILFSPEDFSLGPLNFNTLSITCSTYLWVRLRGCMGACGHGKAQHLEERYDLAGYKLTFSSHSSEASKHLHMPTVHITAVNLVLPAHW